MPEWYEAGKVYMEKNPNVSFGALVYSTIVLSGFAEFKRLNDIRNPGSQGSGILPEDFKGVGGPQGRTVGGPYVGGRFFDPMGLWCARPAARPLAAPAWQPEPAVPPLRDSHRPCSTRQPCGCAKHGMAAPSRRPR